MQNTPHFIIMAPTLRIMQSSLTTAPFLFHTVPLSFNSTKAVPQFLFLLVFNCIKSYLGIGEKWTPKWCKRDDKEQKGKGMVKILVLVLGGLRGHDKRDACMHLIKPRGLSSFHLFKTPHWPSLRHRHKYTHTYISHMHTRIQVFASLLYYSTRVYNSFSPWYPLAIPDLPSWIVLTSVCPKFCSKPLNERFFKYSP